MSESKTSIASSELKALIDAEKVTLLDVRSLTEFEAGHVWTSLHRPIETLPGSIEDITKGTLIVTVCNKGGGRSERAAEILRSTGWRNTRWLEGGYLGWVEAGLPDYEPGFKD